MVNVYHTAGNKKSAWNERMSGNREPARARRGAMHIAEVAALAGVSTATVSRALANPGRVNAKTRAHVLEVVRRTGYTVNVAGRSLRAAHSRNILVVVPNFITPFFSDLLLGVERALSAEGYGLLIGNLQDGGAKESALVDLVRSGQADGVLLLNGHILRGAAGSIVEQGVPSVAVSVPPEDDTIPAVLVEEREGAAAVATHLLELGHRRFGYVTGPGGSYIDAERWAGFSAMLATAGVDPRRIARFAGDFHVRSGFTAGQAFLRQRRRPTAVFAASDMMAIGFMRAVHAAGLAVPGDVAVAGFDGIEFADYCEPPLTTVRQPRETMGRAAAGLLFRLLGGEEIPPPERIVRLPVALRRASSTAPSAECT